MIGLKVLKRRRAVPAELALQFIGVPVANVSDCMSRLFSGGARLRPMHSGRPMSGPALTVRTRPGDNLMIHKALQMAAPGDIIVVDAGGDLTNALIGELMVSTAIRRQLGGFVIDGAIRDAKALREGDFPVFAAGVTHRGPYRDGPGEINVPIALDGMVIEPGDLIIGDDDGVLCVPFDHVQSVLAAARKKAEAEALIATAIAAGQVDTAWIDATLNRLGCLIEPQ
jgi:regulator of RNase E activity RraA